MRLASGPSPWPAVGHSPQIAEPLVSDLASDVLVIGTGVTGALVADALTEEGLETVVVDRHGIAAGSTRASTALLQYDLDVPLIHLVDRIPREHAVRAFRLGVEAIDVLEGKTRGLDVGFERRRSLYVASSEEAVAELKRECKARDAIGLPVRWADADELRRGWGLHAAGAVVSEVAAQVDPVRLTTAMLDRAKRRGARVLDQVEVTNFVSGDPMLVRTCNGPSIRCRYAVHAGGYEAAHLLPPGSVQSFSTFVFLSRPTDPPPGVWADRCLLWEFANPYLYARWCEDRVMVGGEDVPHPMGGDCRPLLASKTAALREKCSRWLPDLALEVDSSWCGTVLGTPDGLGFVGSLLEGSNVLLALCYGGNGMTHAVAAGRLIADHVKGRKNKDAEIFRVRRCSG